jgi:hypothetical protein
MSEAEEIARLIGEGCPHAHEPHEGAPDVSAALARVCAERDAYRQRVVALEQTIRRLLDLPNWENRVGPWKDIRAAVFAQREVLYAPIPEPELKAA